MDCLGRLSHRVRVCPNSQTTKQGAKGVTTKEGD